MSDLIPDAPVDERDARAAQAVLDAWLVGDHAQAVLSMPRRASKTSAQAGLLELRGLLVQTLAQVRAAGVLEGHRAGVAERDAHWSMELRALLEEMGQ